MSLTERKFVDLINHYSNKVEFGEFGFGVSDEWILKAENRLGVQLPPSYKYWLKNFGGGEINGDEIYSIYEIDFDKVVGGDIVYINELNRKNNITSINQLVIQENDQGEFYYFNLNEMKDNGEYPVYCFPGNLKYADDFYRFLEKKIKE